MREVFVNTASIADKHGTPLEYDYSIVVDEIEVGHFFCESYGVKIAYQGGGDTAVIKHITVSRNHIETLVHKLIANTVTPITLHDVMDDWLACV